MDVKKYPNINRDQICPFLTRGKCRYGAKGENDIGKCNQYHPNQCKEYNLNGTTENGCKKGNECSNWHATYICRLSVNSNICTRINCIFKHHKNCSITNNDNHNNIFLARNQEHRMPSQPQGPRFPMFNNRQPPQHQHQYQHQRQQRQQQQMRYGMPGIQQRQPVYQQQYNSQSPQIPEDRLMHLIRTMIREETNYQY